MEAVVESVGDHTSADNIKLSEVSQKLSTVEEDVCQKSNGVVETASVLLDSYKQDSDAMPVAKVGAVPAFTSVNAQQTISEDPEVHSVEKSLVRPTLPGKTDSEAVPEVIPEKIAESEPAVHEVAAVNVEGNDAEPEKCPLNDVQLEEVVESEIMESMNENVRFETEVVVESNDVHEIEIEDFKTENDATNNILSDLGQNIELSDVLRSSDVAENVENNNCSIRQEVFNKEELLDILEGNDVPPAGNQFAEILNNSLESQLALEQLSRLKSNRKQRDSPRKKNNSAQKPANDIKIVKQKSSKEDSTGNQKSSKEVPVNNQKANKEENTVNQKPHKKDNIVHQKSNANEIEKQKPSKEDSIVNALVQDWEDEEGTEDPKSKESSTESTQPVEDMDVEIKEETTNDLSTGDDQIPDLNKSSDDGQPQRRLGRVIKKKVIFDPDNPDTFTKSKSVKNKESDSEKDQHPPKKAKLEQITLRAKSKSPVSKMQWKKPQPKNSKQNKRLTEVDKLLMDEGAVNMIYQLTPEAPKGKKNMKTKAEFIKKLQSSTPESKEMKFRERKKELSRSEDGEPKKILSGKQRSSLSSSVKSPSVSEDFEAHSADDSIIYRRHSSSSYSSTCMSPRRLSDVNDEVNHSAVNSSQLIKSQLNVSTGVGVSETDVFQPGSSVPSEFINKDDCLSIKKKLNSKLSLALNKRKREISKADKPIKKRAPKIREGDQAKEEREKFKFLSVTYDQRVADICIRKTGSKYNIDVLKEMEEALLDVNTRKDISVTLLTSACGALCSELDLISLLDEDIENRAQSAVEIAESVRSLLTSVHQHSKLVCSGVWGACGGVGLALAALSDVCVAGERASFACGRAPLPGLAALRASCLPASTINDLVIFGRELSAAEALQSGLVTRVLWPSSVVEQIHNIVKEIAAQPPQTLLLKKKLLHLKKKADSTFLSQLEAEAALMAEYWTSDESQEILRASNDAV